MVSSVTRAVAFLGALSCVSLSSAASAQELVDRAWLDSQVNERGQRCERRAEQRTETGALLACGSAGVWEVVASDQGPRFVRSFELGGEAVGFFTEADGRLWVKLLVLQAKPLSSGAQVTPGAARFPDSTSLGLPLPIDAVQPPVRPAPAAPPAPPPAYEMGEAGERNARKARKQGHVIRVRPGELVVSLGSDDGLTRGDRIELALETSEQVAGNEALLSREPIAVGLVTSVSEQHARVRLGLNESVPIGAVATPTRAHHSASLAAPPRVAGIWHAEGFARPFAALGELGGGVLLSASAGRRFENGLHLWAVLDPLGLGDVENRNSTTAVNGGLFATYDSQYFEMGLGLGGQTVNETEWTIGPGSGFAFAQYIRLGAVDGLNIAFRTSVVLFYSEFEFGGMVGAAQIPVTRGYWLLFGGGGGNVGYGYGEMGLRVLMRGNGGAGSVFLTVAAGGAGVFRAASCPTSDPCEPRMDFSGPMGGLGGEWRF